MANKTTITMKSTDANVLDLLLKCDQEQITEADFISILHKQYGYSDRVTKAYVAEQLLTAIREA